MRKRPLLVILGIAGACAACCAIPLAVPLLAGLSVAGMASFNWPAWMGAQGWAWPLASGLAAALLSAIALRIARRRRMAACTRQLDASAIAAGTCGCGPRPSP